MCVSLANNTFPDCEREGETAQQLADSAKASYEAALAAAGLLGKAEAGK